MMFFAFNRGLFGDESNDNVRLRAQQDMPAKAQLFRLKDVLCSLLRKSGVSYMVCKCASASSRSAGLHVICSKAGASSRSAG